MLSKEKYYGKVKSPWLQLVVGHKLGALTAHWVFQGMLYMDATERWFKLGLDFLLCPHIELCFQRPDLWRIETLWRGSVHLGGVQP
jgi:hypothetical protein